MESGSFEFQMPNRTLGFLGTPVLWPLSTTSDSSVDALPAGPQRPSVLFGNRHAVRPVLAPKCAAMVVAAWPAIKSLWAMHAPIDGSFRG